MSSKYHIFISSTFEDLKNERKSIMTELWKNGFVPIGMESFSASSRKQWNIIKETLDECDYMVLIVAGRYGTIDSATGISYTEREYNYAKGMGIPVIPFIRKNTEKLSLSKIDTDSHKRQKLESFIAKIKHSQVYDSWTNSNNLAGKVISAINKEIIAVPRPGYSRNSIDSFKTVVTHEALHLYEDIQKAEHFLIFHAAFYPKYLEDNNPHHTSIKDALKNNNSLNVHIVLTDCKASWINEFAKVLNKKVEHLQSAIDSNIETANELKKQFPNQVHLYKSQSLPFAPIVIADNLIAVGHYEHSSIPTPNGIWIKIKNKNITSLTEKLLSNESIVEYTMDDETKVIFRYIEDCVHAIQTGIKIL